MILHSSIFHFAKILSLKPLGNSNTKDNRSQVSIYLWRIKGVLKLYKFLNRYKEDFMKRIFSFSGQCPDNCTRGKLSPGLGLGSGLWWQFSWGSIVLEPFASLQQHFLFLNMAPSKYAKLIKKAVRTKIKSVLISYFTQTKHSNLCLQKTVKFIVFLQFFCFISTLNA